MSAEAAPRTAAKRRRSRWLVAALVVAVLAVAGIAVATFLRPPASPTAGLTTEKAVRTTLVVTVSGDGTTKPVHTTDVYPQVSGTVDEVEVAVGDTVKKGDRLFTIDGTDLEAAVLQARTSLRQAQQAQAGALQQQAQANLQKAQADQQLAKLKSLPATMTSDADIAIAQKSVTAAKASITAAAASLATAKASVANAEHAYSEATRKAALTVVYAPSDGVVTALSVASGGSVSSGGGGASSAGASMGAASASASLGSGAPVVISDLSELKVRVGVNEVDISRLKIGQEATVVLDAVTGLTVDGKVTWISPNGVSTQGVVTYDVDVELNSQDERLRPDMTASVLITTETKKDVVVVPSAAVKVDGAQRYVDVLASDGTTSRVDIEIGVTSDLKTEVVSGLDAGATVVIGTVQDKAPMGFRPPGMGGN